MLESFFAALRFLTVLPAPAGGPGGRLERRHLTMWFPLVGLVIGAFLYLAMQLPLPAPARAAVTLGVWIAVTGGLHEDGWMDVLDAVFAPVPRERRLQILKDPHVGAHGATGGVLLQIARFAALIAVPASALLTAPVLGRWAMAVSVAVAPAARSEGLAAELAAGARPIAPSLVALAILIALAGFFSPVAIVGAIMASALVALLWGALLVRRFGGLTGDGHGSIGVAAELAALWAFLPLGVGPS